MKALLLTATHSAALLIGFGLGVYLLPILTAPPSPDQAMLKEMAKDALYRAELTRDLRGSDFLHWGEGAMSLNKSEIVHEGRLAPGPDYKLYLVKEFVEHEDEFLPIKDQAQLVGDVKTFNGFLLDVPGDVDIEQFTTMVVWCEAFSEFITSAKYR
jgi:hypothetical protein